MSDAQALCVIRVQLYLYAEETGQYTDYGMVGCAIMGSTTAPTFKMGCYNDSNEYLCTAPITANNETSAHLTLQGNGYVCFKDDQNRNWSMLFPSDSEAVDFGAQYAVAMYGAASQPENNIVACDATIGKKDRLIFTNDKVKVRFYSWVVQRGFPGRELAKLGSRLETNEHDDKPYMFTVPANHASVTPEMKGFEGMVVGVGEESRRYIIVPQNAKKGSGPNVHMCFMVNVLRKKDEPKTAGASPQAQQQQQQQQYPYNTMGGGGFLGQQQPFYGQGYEATMQGNPLSYGGVGIGGGMMPGHPSNQLALAGPVSGQQQQLTIVEPPVVNQPPPAAPAPPPPPPGFNNEQLQIVDRMRDQIQALQQQLREATQKLDMFAHDFKTHQQKQKPQSLASAQLEFTIQKLIQETEDLKEELTQRDTTLRQVEDKNKELQKKVDKFTATANQLAEEKKSAINTSSEEKIDLDRRLAQLQSQLTRVMGEREDVSRHLSTVKRLLEVSDQDMKAEKSKLQVALVTFQTNESKLVTTEEALVEERARRKVLESKSITLTDELRTLGEEMRTKESQIDERRRKIESDKLHYNQLMEDERGQAASELRELRQELIDEIAIRDRRYQEERQRVAHESFERGRIQGVDDGHNEALLEADMKIQELVLSVQRNKSEVETMKIRLRQSREQGDSDQRRINAQISALTRAVDDLDGQNSATEMEIDSLKNAKNTVEDDTYDRIAAALRGLSREVGKRDLLTIIHQLRIRRPIDYSFETERIEHEAQRLEEERAEVVQWVRNSIDSRQPLPCPPMRTKAPEEKVLPVLPDIGTSGASGPMTQLPPELAALSVAHEHQRQEDILQFDPEAMNKRYRELFAQLGEENPELGLIEKKPPPKPREPTPEPPREPTPEPPREPTPEPPRVPTPPPQQPTPVVREPSPDRPEASLPTQELSQPPPQQSPSHPLPSLSDDESDQPQPKQQTAAVSRAQPPQRRAEVSDESEDDNKYRAAAPAKPKAPKKPPTFGDSEDEDVPAPPAAKQPVPVSDEDEYEAPPPQKKKSAGAPSRAVEPEPASPPPRPVVAAKQPAAASKAAKSTVFDDSDSDSASAPAAAKPAPPKRAAAAATTAKKPNAFANSEDDDDQPTPKAAGKPQSKAPTAKPAAKKKSMFDDSDDDEPVAPPKKAAAAPQKASAKKSIVTKKKSMFDDSD